MPKRISKQKLDQIKVGPDKKSVAPEKSDPAELSDQYEICSASTLKGVWRYIVNKNNRAATLPQLAQELIDYPELYIWNELVASSSEEYFINDTQGRLYKKGTDMVLINHGLSFLGPYMLGEGSDFSAFMTANTKDFKDYVGPNKFEHEGPILRFEDIVSSGYNMSGSDPYAVTIRHELLAEHEYGNLDRETFIKHPLAMMRLGGAERAASYFDAACYLKQVFLGEPLEGKLIGKGALIGIRDELYDFGISPIKTYNRRTTMLDAGAYDAKAD